MRRIEDFNEFISLWNISHQNRYWGNKKISLEQEQEIIKKADIKDFKRYNIYMLEDNYHFIVIDTKWTIDNDLYYDDETPTPTITLDYFKAKNQVNIKYYEIEQQEQIKPYFMINYNRNDREVSIKKDIYYSNYLDSLQWAKDKKLYYRDLTADEITQYNNIVKELTNDYNERLDKYFKRYNKNIYAIGYWVNR